MITPTPPRPTKPKTHAMPEANIQAECFAWFWNQYPQYRGLYFAVTNQNERSAYESKKQQLISGARRRMIGVIPGVADNIGLIPSRDYHGFCAECKTPKGSQSDDQVAWEGLVGKYQYYYFVYRSLDEFKQHINYYFNGETT